ncbi:MAG: TetR/AcrR family transcriptional regulator [Actinomycetota bacterium]
MAVQVRLSKEERRRRLLLAAQQLFGEKGYRKSEVEEIAARAGVTKPMIYRHFPGGKAELFMEVLDEHIRVLLRALWEAMASSNEAIDRLHNGLEAYLQFAEENPEGFRLLVDSSAELDPGVGDRLREVRDSIARGLQTAIADVMKGAGLTPEGAPVYAHALLGGVESVVAWWLEEKKPSRDIVVDYLLAFLWKGFGGLPKDPTRFHLERS